MWKDSGEVHQVLLFRYNCHYCSMFLLYFNYKLHILQELRMYNPDYLERPYVVVLNKIDLPKVCV